MGSTASPSRPTSSSATSKIMRKWGTTTGPVTAEDMAALDYSTPPPSSPGETSAAGTPSVDVESLVDKAAYGSKTNGLYEVADWNAGRANGGGDGEGALRMSEAEIIASGYLSKTGGAKPAAGDEDAPIEEATTGLSALFSRLSTLTSTKTLTKEDLAPVLQEMEKHLMGKNVAKDIAEKLCDSVGSALVGKKLGGFTSGLYGGPCVGHRASLMRDPFMQASNPKSTLLSRRPSRAC